MPIGFTILHKHYSYIYNHRILKIIEEKENNIATNDGGLEPST